MTEIAGIIAYMVVGLILSKMAWPSYDRWQRTEFPYTHADGVRRRVVLLVACLIVWPVVLVIGAFRVLEHSSIVRWWMPERNDDA